MSYVHNLLRHYCWFNIRDLWIDMFELLGLPETAPLLPSKCVPSIIGDFPAETTYFETFWHFYFFYRLQVLF